MKLKVYTDGGCSPNPGYGGYSCMICFPKNVLSLSKGEKYSTNNRMEVKAVIMALEKVVEYICKKNIHVEEIEIISDSMYVVNGYNSGWLDKQVKNNFKTDKGEEVKNKDLWMDFINALEELDFLCSCKVIFTKVKGHSGNYFNEHCDSMVKEEIKRQKAVNK